MTGGPESSPMSGIRVAFFESRMAGPMADLIAKHGGIPLSRPALREVPLGDSPEVTAFVDQLRLGRIDVIIFETGVGVRYLAQTIETRLPRETWLPSLARTRVVRAGPSRRRRYASWACGWTCTCRRPTPGTRRLPYSTPICQSPGCGLPSRSTARRT